jgi:hypothetical protein
MLYSTMLPGPECTKLGIIKHHSMLSLCCHSFVFVFLVFRFIALAVFLPSVCFEFFRSNTEAQQKADERYASKYTKRQRLTLGLYLCRNGKQAA